MPRLSSQQQSTVTETVNDFAKLPGESSQKVTLRYLTQANTHPERVGFNPLVRACGCEYGFRMVIADGQTTVQRCKVCYQLEVEG